MRQEEGRNENVKKWKRTAMNVQALLREGNGDQKENIRVQDNKRGVYHLEEGEDLTERAGIGKKLKKD